MKNVKQSLLFGRLGNKDTDIKFFKHLLPLDAENIVEPFGGTFSVIRNVYNDDKYNKFVNDTDPQLWKIYENPEGYLKYKILMNEIAKTHTQDDITKHKDVFKEINDKGLNNDIFYDGWHKETVIRGSMIKVRKRDINCSNLIDMMTKINFTNDDYKIVIDKFKHDDKAFIFLDPPYLFSDNSSYNSQNTNNDMTDIIVDILNLFNDTNTKAKIMLVINDLKLLRHLFKNNIALTYSRIYQLSKKINNHLVVTNY